MTYSPSTSYCQLFSECSTLDSEFCPDCLTSQSSCDPDPPACWLQGECSGIADHAVPSQSSMDCLQICNTTIGCRWWTFDSTVNECVLFKTCVEIDESCKDCVSGERRCIDDVTTTSTPAYSTTTETPKGKFQAKQNFVLYNNMSRVVAKQSRAGILNLGYFSPKGYAKSSRGCTQSFRVGYIIA